MKKLDRSKPYITVSGQDDHRYEQDYIFFDSQGLECGGIQKIPEAATDPEEITIEAPEKPKLTESSSMRQIRNAIFAKGKTPKHGRGITKRKLLEQLYGLED